MLEFIYKNYRNEISKRKVIPSRFWFGSTQYHKEEQWLLTAFDVDKDKYRDFALKDIATFNIEKWEEKVKEEIEILTVIQPNTGEEVCKIVVKHKNQCVHKCGNSKCNNKSIYNLYCLIKEEFHKKCKSCVKLDLTCVGKPETYIKDLECFDPGPIENEINYKEELDKAIEFLIMQVGGNNQAVKLLSLEPIKQFIYKHKPEVFEKQTSSKNELWECPKCGHKEQFGSTCTVCI